MTQSVYIKKKVKQTIRKKVKYFGITPRQTILDVFKNNYKIMCDNIYPFLAF